VIVLSVFFLSIVRSAGYVIVKYQYGEQIDGVFKKAPAIAPAIEENLCHRFHRLDLSEGCFA